MKQQKKKNYKPQNYKPQLILNKYHLAPHLKKD